MECLGYKLDFFYINTKNKLKIVWCLIRSQDSNNKIYSTSGLSCKLDIEEALIKSYSEAKALLDIRTKEKNIENKIKLVEQEESNFYDLDKIIYYYSSYNREKDFNKMFRDIPIVEYSDLCEQSSIKFNNLNDTLKFIVLELKDVYDDIIFIDQTPKILRKYNLYCIKTVFENGWDVSFLEVDNYFGRPNLQPIA